MIEHKNQIKDTYSKLNGYIVFTAKVKVYKMYLDELEQIKLLIEKES